MTTCAYCVIVSLCHCVTVSLSHCATVHMFDRCNHTGSQSERENRERGRNRDTRLSRYDSVCILCHCVTMSLCHCPTVPLFTCLTDVIAQDPRVKKRTESEGAIETHVSQGMTACAYCVTVSLCHCVTVSLSHCVTVHMFDRCDHTGSQSEKENRERARNRDTRLPRYDSVCILCHCVTVSLCHCPSVSPFTCLTDVITQDPRMKIRTESERAIETHVSQGMTVCAYCVHIVSLCHCVTVPPFTCSLSLCHSPPPPHPPCHVLVHS